VSQSSVDALETIAGESTSASAREDERLAPGTMLGRYVIVGPAGAGSMGVVYAAVDPELDRKLAVKLLRGRSDRRTEPARSRMLDEAKVLARLAHPNVVAIHDVGTFEGRVWIAMEFIEGETLRKWCAVRPRGWRAVLDVMTAAGQGLVAAHEAGLVHRDFKPENVMVATDGRVRVTDFGLASAPESAPSSPSSSRSGVGERSSASLSRGPVGTPAYMAPEQIAAREHGAAADQFSFCVTCWEAIAGARPFAGDDTASIVAAVLDHRLREPPQPAKMPAWLRRVLMRGLAREPCDRFPSMAALLSALERGQKRRRVIRIATAVALVVAVPAAVVGVRMRAQAQLARRCAEAGAAIASVWPGPAGQARSNVLATLGEASSSGEAIAQRLTPWLDASASRWAEVREQTCRAHAIEGKWSDDMLARADACLEEQRISLEALLQALARADAQVLYASVSLAAGLPLADACADESELERMPPPQRDHADTIRTLRALEARAGTLRAAGHYAPMLYVAAHQLAIAEHAEIPLERVQALVVYGQALELAGRYEEAEVALADAYADSGRIGAPRPAALAADLLIWLVGSRRGRPGEGLVWAKAAEFAIADVERTPGILTSQRLQNLASLHDDRGHYDEAIAAATESLAILEAAVGPEHPRTVLQLGNLGGLYMRAGRLADAEELLSRALGLAEEVLGSEHPEVVLCLTNMGNVLVAMGRPADAVAYYERTLVIIERVQGAAHPNVAATLMNLANARRQTGDIAELEPLYTRAIAIQEEALGPNHPDLANAHTNYGAWLMDRSEWARAKEAFARAIAIEATAGGTERPELAGALHNLSLIHVQLGELDDAARLSERAVGVLDRTVDRTHPVRATILLGRCEIEDGRGEVEEAVRACEEGLEIRKHADVGEKNVAIAEFALARALWGRPHERTRAHALATKAEATLRAAGDGQADAELVTTWLAEHRAPRR
jgi:eukaryotic-like serine/threonine-protein kinase